MKYIPVIGLEIHAELKTKTKIFCGCANDFGSEGNSRCCPVCAGLPGALPVLSGEAVTFAIAAGLALGCEIAPFAKWDRKNYFYPDSPKAYQISQLYEPLCIGGGVKVGDAFIRINHIHLEEDAGKLLHGEAGTLIDFNRTGVPLIEIVTEPDMHSAEEAAAFVEKVRQALVYAGVCDGKMEQGSLRVDANVSIMPEGALELGTRAEIKNVNSFRFIKNAIEYEIKRQEEVLSKGGRVVQETRRYLEKSNETASMRTKEDAHDYRYFPDPDVLPLRVHSEDVERIGESLPESPFLRYERYTKEFGMVPADADTILARRFTADFFDAAVRLGGDAKAVTNALKAEIMRCLNQSGEEITEMPIAVPEFLKIIDMASANKITPEGLKTALNHMFYERISADEAVQKYNLAVLEDLELIRATIREALLKNENVVAQYKSGETKVFGFLMGQCSKPLKGRALPQTIQAELKKALEE